MEKTIRKYTELFKDELCFRNIPDVEGKAIAYAGRLREMYASEEFRNFNIYPTVDTVKVFAVIAMCLELRSYGFSDPEIIDLVNHAFHRIRKMFSILLGGINLLPNSYHIAEKWNINDHEKRVKDGSLTYDLFDVSDGKIEYRVTGCAYVRMFEEYGIRSLCKIFCLTDMTSYAGLTRHVRFIRHSDLSDGDCCHDEVIRK